jgi:type I restriction enzyme M protein
LAKRGKDLERPFTTAATIGYEAQPWQMADALRGSIDASEQKHAYLGPIFLGYFSDAFKKQHEKLVADHKSGTNPENLNECCAQNIYWVPAEVRSAKPASAARQSTINQLVDITIFGQLAMMNLAIRGFSAQIAYGHTLHYNHYPNNTNCVPAIHSAA